MQALEAQERTLQAAWLARSEESISAEVTAIEAALADAGFFDEVEIPDQMGVALGAEEAEFQAVEDRERALRSAWESKKAAESTISREQAAVEEALFDSLHGVYEPAVAATPVKVGKWSCMAPEDFQWEPSPSDTGFAEQLVAMQEEDLMDPFKLMADMHFSRKAAAFQIDSIINSVVDQRVEAAMVEERKIAASESEEKALHKAAADKLAASEVDSVFADVLGSFCKQKATQELAQHSSLAMTDLGGLWGHWEETDSEEERFRAELTARAKQPAREVEAPPADLELLQKLSAEASAKAASAVPTKSKRRVFGRLTRGPSLAELDGSSMKAEKPAACFKMDLDDLDADGAAARRSQGRESSLTRGYESMGSAQIFDMGGSQPGTPAGSSAKALPSWAPHVAPADSKGKKGLQKSSSESALMLDLGIAPPPQVAPAAPPALASRVMKRGSSVGALRAETSMSSFTAGFSYSSKAAQNATYSFSSKAPPGSLASRGVLPMVDPLARRRCVDFALM